MWIVDAVVQWLHIASAMLLIGGLFFALYVMTPVLRRMGGDSRRELADATMSRFRGVVWTAIPVLLATGVYNLMRALVAGHFDVAAYQHTLEAKVLLALLVFVAGIGVTVPGWRFFSSRRRFFVTFNIHLGLLIVLLSAILRRHIAGSG